MLAYQTNKKKEKKKNPGMKTKLTLTANFHTLYSKDQTERYRNLRLHMINCVDR